MSEAAEFSDRSPHVFAHSCREALTLAARLLSFTNSVSYTSPNEASHKQIELALADLVTFALFVRKIGEYSRLKLSDRRLALLPETNVPGRHHADPNIIFERRFWEIANRLIHCQKLQLVQQFVQDHPEFEKLDSISRRGVAFRFALVRSEGDTTFQFCIESFVLTFLECIYQDDNCQRLLRNQHG